MSSSFPGSIDEQIILSDIASGDLANVVAYNTAIANGDYVTAAAKLALLSGKVINAAHINNLSEDIISIETYLHNRLLLRGAYDGSVAYIPNDCVIYNKQIWKCKSPTIGITPAENTYWTLLLDNTTASNLMINNETLSNTLSTMNSAINDKANAVLNDTPIISDSVAPSTITHLWFDTTNKALKYYNNGSWESLTGGGVYN